MGYAIIRSGGKQFRVEEGGTVRVPSLAKEAGDTVELEALVVSADLRPAVAAERQASSSTVSPASFASEGTRTVPPSSTRNCLPPDLMIA
jgi:ribosomal protein L21